MSRYLGSVCKLCRREKEKLFLKGDKCATKCTLETKRGKNLPGGATTMRGKTTEYAKHLREKQKARRVYGLNEEQFRHYFARAERMKGLTGDNLLKLLELRLDNIVYRLGIVSSRRMARQMVTHGNVLVNDKKIDFPSYQMKPGDKVSVVSFMKENIFVKKSLENPVRCPSWLELNKEDASGTVKTVPMPDEYSHPIDSQLIVELYSK
ncbi:MAG: 30S ribosomal protein S4 [Elusimicrobiota bacterium]